MTHRILARVLRWRGKEHLLPFVEGLLALGRPSTVNFPPELLEQGVLVALSGIGNTMAIQSNPDWVWPLWVERQTSPERPEFVPTGLNVLTTNVTGRNWTSIGVDGSPREAMVDPAGMLTPHPWGWSILPWLRVGDRTLVPSRLDGIRQNVVPGTWSAVRTTWEEDGLSWTWTWEGAELDGEEGVLLEMTLRNASPRPVAGRLGIALRPCNALSIGHVNHLAFSERVWKVNGRTSLLLFQAPSRTVLSDRHHGDPLVDRGAGLSLRSLRSRSGIATGVSDWSISLLPKTSFSVMGFVPLDPRKGLASRLRRLSARSFDHARERMRSSFARLGGERTSVVVPDGRLQTAFDSVANRLRLFDDQDHFSPGTFLYHQHWFRDAAFLALGFENMGMGARCVRKLELQPRRQDRDGFFRSQGGEWDSNGQALWTLGLHVRRGGDPSIADRTWKSVVAGAEWIDRMRRGKGVDPGHVPHRGLMPAGFSAEHFGPNDHYLWDNFWSIAGLGDAVRLARLLGKDADAARIGEMRDEFAVDLEAAIRWSAERWNGILPSSPYRRPDAAAVGNLVAASPLGVSSPLAHWMGPTLDFLMERCWRKGLFFQSIVHTGLNPYLSVQVARVLLARGDDRAHGVLQALLDAASPTWCWPEAIHPGTGGGCMGDGDHGWAAAEFLSLVRDMFVRESSEGLVLLSGAPSSWFRERRPFSIADAPTDHGTVSVGVEFREGNAVVKWSLRRASHQEEARCILSMPGDGARVRRVLEGDGGEVAVRIADISKESL
jgi:hypothetical protein